MSHLRSSALLTLLPAMLLSLVAASSSAAEVPGLELFEKRIRPALLEHCQRCHGADKQQGGLRLDSREGWMRGGDSGPVIVPGKPQESLLMHALHYEDLALEMPPKGKLPAAILEAFESWILAGAPDPREHHGEAESDAPPTVEQGREFWAFQPVDEPTQPPVQNTTWPATEIDRYVLAKWESAQIPPPAEATDEQLVRRLYFDLTGLPPTPEQIRQYRRDPSPAAYARLVDRLLNSPRFGQRWGRHWLSVVRYAESSGGGRTLLFPDAWRYRDYVIDSFNNDVPYDQFLREQIAGDLLPHEDWQQRRRQLTATAFLLLGPTNYELQDKDVLEMDIVDEQLDTLGKSVLGMTIGCARCHDHKFDPIPTADYYALAGIFKSTRAVIHSNVSTWNTAPLPVDPAQQAADDAAREKLDRLRKELASAEQQLVEVGGQVKKPGGASIDPKTLAGIVVDDDQAEKVGEWKESTHTRGYVGRHYVHDQGEQRGRRRVIYRPELPAGGTYEVRISYTAGSNRSTRAAVQVHHRSGQATVAVNQRKVPDTEHGLLSLGTFVFAADPAADNRVVISNDGPQDGVVIADAVVFVPVEDVAKTPASDAAQARQQRRKTLAAQIKRLNDQIKKLEKRLAARPKVMATTDEAEPADIPIAIRGVVHQPGPMVPRGGLQVVSQDPFPAIPARQSGRLQLAQWLTDADNPLTSRVMANRIWQWTMGRGLVRTVDNFGSMGQRPTHPELLDYLADRFVDGGWAIKPLVREIVLSRVYRLSTEATPAARQADPNNDLFSRLPRKRLHAEQIRDALLAIGGNLDDTLEGSTIRKGTRSEYGYQFTSTRRSVYVPVFRNRLPEIFEVFDFPDPNLQSGSRSTSTIASQALLLMNHPLVMDQAAAAARRLLERPPEELSTRIDYVYRQVIGRTPNPSERQVLQRFVSEHPDGPAAPSTWADVYQTLFQSIDFRHLF
ncbi:DUF1553 domain-containing protein [Roseimaritima sediminicola]|uniref:DUF1553 domain-containing protein n=1 Tax=Roseimaritima sediminicola TaxID=2662066 RepID=UPI001386A1E8|nr:DUF1553 domain-containing protein [Roseimaritima sediminicola]